MSRRLTLLAIVLSFAFGIAVLSSLPAHSAEVAQRVMRLGVVWPFSPSATSPDVKPFWERLRELGYIEGQNLVIESRWAEGRFDQLPALAAGAFYCALDVLVGLTVRAIRQRRATPATVPTAV